MCIYYIDEELLKYDGGDHIILAGLGGKKKLPKGYVSDQFNNDMSLIEQDFLRNSFVAVARAFEGPGKNGKLGERYESKSKINIFEGNLEQHPFLLGYMKKSITYVIPHFIYNSHIDRIISLAPINDETIIFDFIEKCKKGDSCKIKTIYDERINENLILFGIQSGIEENYDGFVAQNANNKNVLDFETIKQIAASISLNKNVQLSSSQYTRSLSVGISEDHFRVFAKMAFNCLSYIKGTEFVKAERFNKIREWIAEGGKNEFVWLNMNNYNPFTLLGVPISNSEHFIWIWTVGTDLIAYINLYGRAGKIIKLCENNMEQMQADGLVCDWRAQKEYSISEYIRKYTDGENIKKQHKVSQASNIPAVLL